MDSIESLEAEQHVGAYIRVIRIALYLEDVCGGVVHSNGGGCGQHDRQQSQSNEVTTSVYYI